MHYALPVLIWMLSFAAAYSAGRLWVEAKHAGGFHWIAAWLLAAITAIGFTAAYFLLVVALLETFQAETMTPDTTAALWESWILFLAPSVVALGGISLLGPWARTYRDEIVARSNFPSYERLNDQYAAVKSTPQAVTGVVRDLTQKTRRRLRGQGAEAYVTPVETPSPGGSGFKPPKFDLNLPDGDGGGEGKGAAVVLLIVAVIIAVCLGAITTWVIISRIAGEAEPLPSVAAGAT
jgi:hypothetical protein